MDDAQRDIVWHAIYQDETAQVPTARETRHHDAIDILDRLRRQAEEARCQGDKALRLECAKRAALVFQVLASDAAGWIVDAAPFPMGTDGRERTEVWGLLEFLDQTPSLFKDAIDPTPVMLPRRLRDRLHDMLEALDDGEVLEMAKPEPTGRRGMPWTMDQARLRALEHVAFLAGTGEKKESAYAEVGEAIGHPGPTVEYWERTTPLAAR